MPPDEPKCLKKIIIEKKCTKLLRTVKTFKIQVIFKMLLAV
jgi:hypothetical protein